MQLRFERGAGMGVPCRRGSLGAVDPSFEARPEDEPTAVSPRLPDTDRGDALDLVQHRDRLAHQLVGIAVLQRPAAQAGDRGLLGGRTTQLLLGRLALGDVVEDAVPNRRAGLVGLEHGLVEDPDRATVAGDHPVVDRRRVAGAERLARLLLERALSVVGVQQLRPELRIGEPLLRRVAENLFDLWTDVAPAPVLSQLRRIDDRRQPLDQVAIALATRRDLVEELVDSFFGPAAAAPAGALHFRLYRPLRHALEGN